MRSRGIDSRLERTRKRAVAQSSSMHHPCSGEKGAERLMYLQVIKKHKDHYSDGDEYQFGNADTDVWAVETPFTDLSRPQSRTRENTTLILL